ncbi:MAG: hypothetical protein IPN18_05285 [Ignavibacteriales bacterium]|nr:hypothetical protein [Ignavibacteriales bacterium]
MGGYILIGVEKWVAIRPVTGLSVVKSQIFNKMALIHNQSDLNPKLFIEEMTIRRVLGFGSIDPTPTLLPTKISIQLSAVSRSVVPIWKKNMN